MISAGRTLAPALLFFGCRAPGRDDIYRDDLDKWQRMGAVDVRRAYSQSSDESESQGCKYVQERLWQDRKEVTQLWEKGAKVFVCGSSKVSEAAKGTVLKIRAEWAGAEESPDAEAKDREWFEGLRNVRYVTDVFD